ncbi:hypothetical protein ACFLS9_05655 [Bacteroidota bacterium]
MRSFKLYLFVILISGLIFVGCESTNDTEDDSNQEQVEQTFTEMDQMMAGSINNLTNSQLFMALIQMPEGLIDTAFIPFSLAKSIPTDFYSIKKSQKIIKMFQDSTVQNLMELFQQLLGTHTYDADSAKWIHDIVPLNEIIIIYPFVDLNDGSPHFMNLRVFDVAISTTFALMSSEVNIDNNLVFSTNLDVQGNDILNETQPDVSSIGLSGIIVDDTGIQINYSMSLTNSGAAFSIGVTGVEPLILTISGDGFLDPRILDEESDYEPDLNYISLSYGNVELVIDDFESTEGDIGDVFYNDNKVGDLVMIDDEPYIEFNNGNQVPLADLMGNTIELVSGLPIPIP